jgi:hypothetical protein
MYQFDLFIGFFTAMFALVLVTFASQRIPRWERAQGYLKFACMGSIYGAFAGFAGLVAFFYSFPRLGYSDEFQWLFAPIFAAVSMAGALIGTAIRYAGRPRRNP